MGNLIRRNKATPVDVRRMPVPMVDIPLPPAAAPGSPGHPQPNVTQNFVYVTAPPAAAAATPPPAQPAPAPTEVHYHTTVHHFPRSRSGVRMGLSFFGTVGLVLGALGCAAYFIGEFNFVLLLAEAGAVAGCLGLLASILLRRSGAGVPFLGLLVSGAAYLLWMNHAGQLPKVDLGQDGTMHMTPANKPAKPAKSN